jgi:hypothetical protein
MTATHRHRPIEGLMRRWLLIAATCPTILGMLHHGDHVLRGSVGWPLVPAPNPFTYSLAMYAFVLPGLYFTARGRLWAGYWFAVALVGLALVVPVHFGSVPNDSMAHIHAAYTQPAFILAMVVLFGLVARLCLQERPSVCDCCRNAGDRSVYMTKLGCTDRYRKITTIPSPLKGGAGS